MLIRTHLALIILLIILFLPHVSSKLIFIVVALAATFIPDIDTGFSTLGKMKGFRFLQFFVRHRGFLHSLTFCIIISILFAFFLPSIVLPFFLGYSVHLFLDSFTMEGIVPFWPYKKTSNWRFKTGSLIETSIFVFLVIIDLLLFVLYVKSIV